MAAANEGRRRAESGPEEASIPVVVVVGGAVGPGEEGGRVQGTRTQALACRGLGFCRSKVDSSVRRERGERGEGRGERGKGSEAGCLYDMSPSAGSLARAAIARSSLVFFLACVSMSAVSFVSLCVGLRARARMNE